MLLLEKLYVNAALSKFQLLFILLLSAVGGQSQAFEKGWYFGGGAGVTQLNPDLQADTISVQEDESTSVQFILGYDASQVSSFELVLSDLGESQLSNATDVTYMSVDFTGLYRFYDHRESNRNAALDFNLFGKLGLGYLALDSDTDLETNSRVHMLAAIGAELNIFYGLSLRAELSFIDTDAQAASLSLLKRFQFAPDNPARDRIKVPLIPTPQAVNSEPVDAVADDVLDTEDECINSTKGYPVRHNGCALFNGVIRDIEFADNSAYLTNKTKSTLAGLAKVFNQYPQARVQLSSHTKAVGNESVENQLTRNRLRNMALYLRDIGVNSTQVKYVAFGAKIVDLKSEFPDRIEIKEIP